MKPFRVACIQNTATRDIPANVEWVCNRIDEAVANGAELIALPETVGLMEPVEERIPEAVSPEGQDAGLIAFCGKAREHGVMILVGSQLIREAGKIFNRCFLLDHNGQIKARYDKIHMFDIRLPNGEIYRESDAITPGTKAVTANTPFGVFGLSICYDLRFGALYRALAHEGAEIITIPASFTHTTGKAHWHALVRARAIETGAFVVAPNQCGHHVDERYSYGHSLVVDPWGRVLADGGPDPGLIFAEIDVTKVAEVRRRIPVLDNERTFSLRRL